MAQNQYTSESSRPFLSVVIPTYDRPMELARMLKVLLPQARLLGVPVCILDNACPIEVENVMESFGEFRDLVKIIRNRVNIGGNANICRCFEICESEWMWMPGDDDIPDEKCLLKILEELKNLNSRVCYVNFSCNNFKHPLSLELDGLDALAEQLRDRTMASNLLFISVGVFNISACRKHLIVGYQHIYTCAPHLAILFSTLANNAHSCKFSTRQIVMYMPPNADNQWSMLKLFAGIPGLYELHNQYSPMRSIMKVFLVQCRWNLFLPNGIVAIFCHPNRPARYWLLILFRAAVLGNNWVRTQCALMIMTLPLASIPISRNAIGMILRRFDKKITAENKRE